MADFGDFARLAEHAMSAQDPEEIIPACESALAIHPMIVNWPSDSAREKSEGTLLGTLGNAYQNRVRGKRADNLERAIAAHQATLTVYVREASPEQWAHAQNNLGRAYRSRIRGVQADNLERAIAAHEAALTVYTREAFPHEWARTQNNLGIAYKDRIRGERADNLERAIAAYEAALTVRTREQFPHDWAATQHNLGFAYWYRIRGERVDNLERAIAAYEVALTVRTREQFPRDWAVTQNNLGLAYWKRILGERADNLERAIAAYEAALTVHTREAFPHEWARTQNNLGIAYKDRIPGEHADNLERSITAYDGALTVYTREAFPRYWAQTKDNLGTTYWRRIRGERADNLEQAIAAYDAALTVYTREAFPEQWAQSQNNLGLAYWNRIRGEHADNLERAIAAYEAALTVYTREAFPQEWARGQNNIGLAYNDRIRGERADNLERAIAAYEAALTVYTREAFPQEWARARNNVGLAYNDRIRGERADNLERAIAAYEAALTVYTREAFPRNWAQTQTNLGLSYWNRIRGAREDNLRQAIAAHQAALTVYTPEAFPRGHLRTAGSLGRIQLANGDWRCAAAAYAGAREAFVLLFGQGLNRAEADDIISKAGPLFVEAAYAAAEQGDLAGAFSLLMEGKARLIGVMLRQINLPLSGEARTHLEMLRHETRQMEREAEAAKGEAAAGAFQRLIALRRDLGALMKTASERETDQGGALLLAGKLTTDGGAVVAPIVADIGGKALIVAANGEGLAVTEVDFPRLTTKRLRELMRGPDHEVKLGGWLVAYNKNYEMGALRKKMEGPPRPSPAEYETLLRQHEQLMREWLAAVGELGPELWRLIGQDISGALAQRDIKRGERIIWMPSGALGILPIGLAADPATGRRFGDDFEIVDAPSLEALRAAERQIATADTRTLAVAVPDNGLPSVEFETSVIASHFDPSARTILAKSGATSQATLDALRARNYWHFATHGSFDWGDARRSSLRMSGGDELTINTLIATDGLAKPRLVALSACETGLFDFQSNADEFIGLPGTFMALGAAGVLGTLWPVEDRATALLVAKFYDLHLGDRLAPPTALKEAQAWLKNATRGELIAYAKATASRSGANGAALADKLETSLLRGPHEDPRFAPLTKLVEHAGRAAAAGGKTLLAGLLGRKPRGPRLDDRPFAHPYYWGGFTYTGL
jgi:CHAT domain-containing protein/tetratricopeptide (TPR) repeat protein